MFTFIAEHIMESLFVFVSGVFTFYVKRHRAVELGVQALLRNEIISLYNKYIDKGYCPIFAKENIDAMYKQYHALGGNGTVTELVKKLIDLPTEP